MEPKTWETPAEPTPASRIDVSDHFEDEAALGDALDRALAERSDEGQVTLDLGDAGSVSFAFAEGSATDLRTAFGLEGDPTDTGTRIADVLNDQSFDQVRTLTETLPEETARDLFVDGDMAGALEPHALMGVLSGLPDEAAEDLVTELGGKGVLASLRELSTDELDDMLWGTGGERLETIFSSLTSQQLDGWYGSLSATELLDVADRFDGLAIESPVTEAASADSAKVEEQVMLIQTVQVEEEEEEQQEEDDAEGVSGDCFVATVVFDDPQHPAVWMLRWFRDMVLRRSRAGRMLVALYWRIGPVMARSLSGHPLTVVLLRLLLAGLAQGIALAAGRRMGRQSDHVYWAENRACRLPRCRRLFLGMRRPVGGLAAARRGT